MEDEVRKESIEKPVIKKNSFSCITKFGIKMTAEDCNLEILRLSYAIPSSSTTLRPIDKSEPLIITTSLIRDDDWNNDMVLATPIDLSMSTPLRFETEKDHSSAESKENELEKNWKDEPSSLKKIYHIVNNYLNKSENSSGPYHDASNLYPANDNRTSSEGLHNER